VDVRSIVSIFVGLVIFGALLPLLTSTISSAGATGTVGTLMGYLPLFLCLGVILSIIYFAIGKLRTKMINPRQMVSAIIILVIGAIFYPLIDSQVSTINQTLVEANQTAAANLAVQIPLFYVLALVFIAITFALRSVGKLGK